MNIEDFLPAYPTIEEKESYPVFDTSFNQTIFDKKEFYDYKLERSPPRNHTGRGLLRHQVIVQRFLSPYTLYDDLFLYHAPGSGKTMSAIGVCEHFFNSDVSPIKKALVLVNNDELINRFIRELYTSIQDYMPKTEDLIYIDPARRQDMILNRAKQIVSQHYSFYTYRTFFTNVLNVSSDEKLIRDYSNKVIVFDEVHHILQEDSEMYPKYHHFFHIIDNRKLLLMTGTPMRNEAVELARLLNLMLPLNEQLPIDDFDAYIETDEGILDIQDAMKGRVSYVRTRTDIDKEYIGDRIYPIEGIKLYPSFMSDFQYNEYKEVRQNEKIELLVNSRKASQMVFDGELTKENFMSKFRRMDTKGKLKQLKKYSAKYANAIEQIIYHKNQNCFVFTEFIANVGAVAFGWCLELFGYSNTKTGVNTPGRRYSILASSQGTDLNSVIQSFNQKQNNRGKYIQVLVGGKQVGEGYTFRNVQQIHILTAQWNFSIIDQAIARGVRFRSHRDLEGDGVVSIFLHVSLRQNIRWDVFVDLIMYNVAMEKDLKIKALEYLAKVTSFDCALSYKRNVQEFAEDGSRECEYEACRYGCDGVRFPYILTPGQLDTTTYNLYYGDLNFEAFLVQLKEQLRGRFSIPLIELWEAMNQKYTIYQFMFLLTQVLRKAIPIENPLGFPSYLKQEQDYLFLTNSVLESSLTDSFYTVYPANRINNTFRRSINLAVDNQIKRISQLMLEEQKQVLSLLPKDTQERFIEQSISSIENEEKSELAYWIVDEYKKYIVDSETHIESLFVTPTRVYNKQTKQWDDLTSTEVETQPSKLLYGKYDKGKFKIIDIRNVPKEKQKTIKGQVCKTMGLKKLKALATELNIDVPDKIKINQLCSLLENWFKEKELLF